MTAVIALEGVRVARGTKTVLDVPALSVEEGEVLGIMGPNGAGKSTLLRVLGLLESPDTGSVTFRGRPVTMAAGLPVRRRMASVFQDPLLADASVLDNVALGLRFRGVARDAIRPRVTRWLERFGIASLAARRARTLSGGEAQRTALARALVVEPELLLLDEPFSALDQPTRDALLRDLRGILSAERVTTVLVTHHRGEALALGDRLAVLIGGAILQVGPAAEVFRAPTSAEVAQFVGLETLVEGVAVAHHGSRSSLQVGAHRIEVAEPTRPGERVLVCVRAEDVSLHLATDSDARRRGAGRSESSRRARHPLDADTASRAGHRRLQLSARGARDPPPRRGVGCAPRYGRDGDFQLRGRSPDPAERGGSIRRSAAGGAP